jgi:AraC-like DNA-binding protein
LTLQLDSGSLLIVSAVHQVGVKGHPPALPERSFSGHSVPLAAKIAKAIDDTLEFHFFDAALTRLTAGHTTAWRSMPLTAVVHLRGGRGELDLADGKALPVPDGASFLAPRLTHRFRLVSGQQPVSRWAHFEFRVLSTINVLSLFDVPAVVQGPPSRNLGDICEALAALQPGAGLDFRCMAREKELGFRLLGAILGVSTLKPTALRFLEGANRLAPVLEHIRNHLAEDLTPEFLAHTVSLSLPRFYAVFKDLLGVPPLAYQRSLRLEHARFLLMTTDANVSEVAEALGFCDPYHFSRQFKRAFQMSPSECRTSRMR